MNENIDKKTKEMGERIKKCLEEKGMTQRELAEKVNTTEVSISRYICGDRIAKGPVMSKIANTLGVTMEYLITGEDAPFEGHKSDKWIPTKVALPKQDGCYLVTTKNGAVREDHYYLASKEWAFGKTDKNIAWMYKPEPYKENVED